MTRTDYLTLRKVHKATGDVALGRLLLAYELRRRPSSPAEVVQLRLSCVEVYCEPLAARVTVAECIRRQSAKTASGAGRGYPVHEACARCRLKDVHRAMAPAFTPAPWRPFNVNREAKQRRARQKLWRAGALEPVRTIDGADE